MFNTEFATVYAAIASIQWRCRRAEQIIINIQRRNGAVLPERPTKNGRSCNRLSEHKIADVVSVRNKLSHYHIYIYEELSELSSP